MKFIPVCLTLLLICGLASTPARAQDNNAAAVAWISKVLPDILTYDPANFETKKQASRLYFSEKGYANFYNALKESGILDMMTANKQSLVTTIKCDPEVLSTDEEDGKTVFKIRVPTDMVYTTQGMPQSNPTLYDIVMRQSSDPQSTGYAIDQVIGQAAASVDPPHPCFKNDESDEAKLTRLKQERDALQIRVNDYNNQIQELEARQPSTTLTPANQPQGSQ